MIYQIWCEGHVATGESSGAILLGSAFGKDFIDACNRLSKLNLKFARFYNSEANTYWGCRLFDNESDARKSFG